MLSVFCFSGIIFGWAPLELLLFQEGQYLSLCQQEEEEGEIATDYDNGGGIISCATQRNKLNFIFTMSQFTLSFVSLPIGFLLDSISKPYYYLLTAIIEIIGLIISYLE